MKPRNGDHLFWLCAALAAAIFVLGCILGAGCTVAPRQVVPRTPSWDSQTGRQDSGLIAITPAHQAIITTNAMERFRRLAPLYGRLLDTPITNAFGYTGPTETNTYILTPDALAAWMQINVLSANPSSTK